MAIIRVNKDTNYTVINNTCFYEKGMSLKALGLLVKMLSLPPTWDFTVAGLVAICKEGKDSIMSALKELEKFGYLERTKVRDNKGHIVDVEYDIYEVPNTSQTHENKEVCPDSENPHTGNPNTENPPQLNTNISNRLNKDSVDAQKTKRLSAEDKKELEEKYSKKVAKHYINRARLYKGCYNKQTIEKWIKEDNEKKQNVSSNKTNQFNNFTQRQYSPEYMSDLERRLLLA